MATDKGFVLGFIPFYLRNSMLIPPFSPTFFSVLVNSVQDWRSHVFK